MRKTYIPVVDIPGTDEVRHLAACNTPNEAAALASASGLILAEIETVFVQDEAGATTDYSYLCYHLIGRTLITDVLSPNDGAILAHKGTVLTRFLVDALSLDCGIDEVHV